MKSAISKLGNKTPTSKVICVFRLFSSFVMSHHTEHLIIESLGSSAPDNGTEQWVFRAWRRQAHQQQTMARPPRKEAPQGLRLAWARILKGLSLQYVLRGVTVHCCSVWGKPGCSVEGGVLLSRPAGRDGSAIARGLLSGLWIGSLGPRD